MSLPPSASRRTVLAALGTASIGGLAGCSGDPFAPDRPEDVPPPTLGSDDDPPVGVWAGPGGDLRNTRFAAVTPIREPTIRWESPFAGFVGGVTRDRLSLTRPGPAGERATLATYALADGTLEWETAVDHPIAAPWSDGSTLYASGTGRVRRVGPDGQLGWTHDLYTTLTERVHGSFLPARRDRFRVSSPVVADGVAHVTSSYGLHGLDADSGAELWRLWVEDASRIARRPTVAPESVYFVGPGDDGASVGNVFEDEPIRLAEGLDEFCPPVAVGVDHAFGGPAARRQGGTPGTLLATPRITPEGGFTDADQWWFVGHHTSAPRGRRVTRPAVGPDRVYVGDTVDVPDGLRAAIYAVEPVTGTTAWTHRVAVENATPQFEPELQPVVSAVAATADVVYAGVGPTVDASPTDPHLVGDEAGVLALDAETGERLWFERIGFLPDDLAVVDAHVVAWDRDRNLAVLGEA
ncbi:outer membrane protein assembly factor BamB family protein [Salinigranum salinum]|uniref:outer membrane protein assembly factor BamB family protein n=1 Tax=Salinigranum salinum TaxID=1364937 RepID=UPI001863DA02|nr:PQQ-binding-like beta-propeller repeat protein [Salinigranum salinum]